MGNIESAIAKLDKYGADMEADAKIIDALAERIRASAKAMIERAGGIGLAMGWTR